MKLRHLAFAGIALVAAAPACAQSAWDGTWKVDVASAQLPTKPRVVAIKDGTYSCSSCVPAYSVKADGAFHSVAGQPYWDAAAVDATDPRSVKLRWRRGAKDLGSTTETLSADGKTLSFVDVDTSAPNGTTATVTGDWTRIAAGAPGSHALSGSWRRGRTSAVSDTLLTMSLKTQNDMVTMRSGTGEVYTAKLGGGYVAVDGDVAGTRAKLDKIGANTLRETNMRGGKIVSVNDMTFAPGGKTMTIKSQNKLQGTTASFTAMKQ